MDQRKEIEQNIKSKNHSPGRWEGIMGGRVFRNNYKGHMDKTKGGLWQHGREVGMAGVGGKCRQL